MTFARLSILILFLHDMTAAAMPCVDLRLLDVQKTYKDSFADKAEQVMQAGQPIGPLRSKVGGQTYTVVRQIASAKGDGKNGDTYLAHINNEYVVIKHYKSQSGQIRAQDLLEYEVYATEFLRERGFDVAAPIHVDRKNGVLVKPLIKGVTVRDVTADTKIPDNDASLWLVTHNGMVNRLARTFNEFATWLSKRNPVVYQQLQNSEINHWLTEGDFRQSAQTDIVFDVEQWRWVLLDP